MFTTLASVSTIAAGGLTEIIINGGLWVIILTVFIECGFFGGFFLPGDSMLFLAGFMAGQGKQSFALTILLIFTAAVAGNVVGYHIGAKAGPKLFRKEDGIFFQKANILRAQQFYERHGGKTLILARFVPVLRTFAPLVAGIGTMTFRRFFIFSSIGAAIWAILVPTTGFIIYRAVGKAINIGPYMEAIFITIIVVSVGGSLIQAWREKRKHSGQVSTQDLVAEQATLKSSSNKSE
jgi:membrane-associated protein